MLNVLAGRERGTTQRSPPRAAVATRATPLGRVACRQPRLRPSRRSAGAEALALSCLPPLLWDALPSLPWSLPAPLADADLARGHVADQQDNQSQGEDQPGLREPPHKASDEDTPVEVGRVQPVPRTHVLAS